MKQGTTVYTELCNNEKDKMSIKYKDGHIYMGTSMKIDVHFWFNN